MMFQRVCLLTICSVFFTFSAYGMQKESHFGKSVFENLDPDNCKSLTIYYVRKGDYAKVQEIVEAQNNISRIINDSVDLNDSTLLYHAVNNNDLSFATFLLQKGASIHAKNRRGVSPLSLSQEKKLSRMSQLLEESNDNKENIINALKA